MRTYKEIQKDKEELQKRYEELNQEEFSDFKVYYVVDGKNASKMEGFKKNDNVYRLKFKDDGIYSDYKVYEYDCITTDYQEALTTAIKNITNDINRLEKQTKEYNNILNKLQEKLKGIENE